MSFIRSPETDRSELEALRNGVACAALLEREGFLIDKAESTRRCQKYRRAAGGVIIVNHDGRGWWDPHDAVAKGDVIKLVQHLHSGMSLGHVRQFLRPLIGVAPTAAPFQHNRPEAPLRPVADLWASRPDVRRGSPVWTYLSDVRTLPDAVIETAIAQGVLREGIRGTAWFAHRDAAARLTGIEMRGPSYRGFSAGGDKTLFRVRASGTEPIHRLVVCEAPIDALSYAALDQQSGGTLYVATAGGMGPHTLDALRALMADLVMVPGARLLIATDHDEAGERYAAALRAIADAVCLWSGRSLPPGGHKDWNAALTAARALTSTRAVLG